MSKLGYTDENGEWVDYMTKEELKASTYELGRMGNFFQDEELNSLRTENAKLKSDNAVLMEAVRFYASTDNYGSDDVSRTTGNKTFDIVLFDFDRDWNTGEDYAGKRAREALKKVGV